MRTCSGGCGKSIDHLCERARYCGSVCRNQSWRKRGENAAIQNEKIRAKKIVRVRTRDVWCKWCGEDLVEARYPTDEFCDEHCLVSYHEDLGQEWVGDALGACID